MLAPRGLQNKLLLDARREVGVSKLGLMVNQSWNQDPKRFLLTLDRYKFVSKMFSGLDSVIEVGCADAFGKSLVQQVVSRVVVSDLDELFLKDARERMSEQWAREAIQHDMLSRPSNEIFNGVFCLDVLEYIRAEEEDAFLTNIIKSIKEDSFFIAGMSSLESQKYASPQSLEGLVNCKTESKLKHVMLKHFKTIFIYSMNDEVQNTGFHSMSNYLFALCT